MVFRATCQPRLVTLLFIQIHYETNIFSVNQRIWEREKRGLISYLLA